MTMTLLITSGKRACTCRLLHYLLLTLCTLSLSPIAVSAETPFAFDQCMLEAMKSVGSEATIGELRAACSAKVVQPEAVEEPPEQVEPRKTVAEESAIDRRLRLEKLTRDNPFVITPHKPNYILLASHTDNPNEEPFQIQFPNENTDLKNVEAKFQISVKFPLVQALFDGKSDLNFAYTNRSFWQVYNSDISAPFRETNHEPEIWLAFPNDWKFLGFTNTLMDFGFNHQSNGRGGTLSRSWNRIFAEFVFERNNFYFGFKPWYRIPEDDDDDDNPDIDDFLGDFEFQGVYKKGGHTFGLMFRNNLETSDNHGAIQGDWSFPFYQRLRGYVQIFSGYGESLIDYNHGQTTFGIGVQLVDWL